MAENAANVNLKPAGALFFFFHAIYIQGNPENVPNLNVKKTHGMVQLALSSLFLYFSMRTSVCVCVCVCVGVCAHLDWLYYVLE